MGSETTAVSGAENRDVIRRREILAAANDLFLTEGYERTSMRNIASRLNVTATTLYLYFQSKEHLLSELVRDSFAELLAKIDREISSGGSPDDQLGRIVDTSIRFGVRNPSHFRVLFGVLCHPSGGINPPEIQLIERISRILEGHGRPKAQAHDLAEVVWGAILGVVQRLSAGADRSQAALDHGVSVAIGMLVSGAVGRLHHA